MSSTAVNMTTDWDSYLGTRRVMNVQDTTTRTSPRGFTYTHENSVVVTTATNYGHSIILTTAARGSMLGELGEAVMAIATTHLTANEARALATMLNRAASELKAAQSD
jgi:altronate dehydratase